MAGGREAVAAVMVAAAACLWAGAAAAVWGEEERLRDYPCPSAEDIFPCVCTVDKNSKLNMDCSDVQTSQELGNAFHAHFPLLTFYEFLIENNQHMTDLRAGDLGNATFEIISMHDGVLETVAPGALAGSYHTLRELKLSRNHISLFPFDELTYFTRLKKLYLFFNDFGDFPHIHSNTLVSICFDYNPLERLNSTALQDLPNLVDATFTSCSLTQVEPETFVGLKKLRWVSLGNNQLTILRENTVEFTEEKYRIQVLSLYGNQLTTVEPNAIKVNGSQVNDGSFISMNNNQLTELNEDVWRPLLDNGFPVHVSGNPLTCGCDIAWIVLNPDYLNLLDAAAACADDVLVSDLDPAVFEANCT